MKFYDGSVILILLSICGADRQYKAGIALRSLGDVVITGDYASLAVVCTIQELELLVDRCNYAFRFMKAKIEGTQSTFQQKFWEKMDHNHEEISILARKTELEMLPAKSRQQHEKEVFKDWCRVDSLELQVVTMNKRLNKLARLFRDDGHSKLELKLLYGKSLEKAQLMNSEVEEELSKSDLNKRLPILKQPDLGGIWDATVGLIHELEAANNWPTKDILLNEIVLFKNSFRNARPYRKPLKEETTNVSVVLNATIADLKSLKQNYSKDISRAGGLLFRLYGAIEIDISISSRLSFFGSILQDLNDKIRVLLEGLDCMLASGRLNPQLAPPKNLTVAIRDSYRDLPKSFKPMFDLNFNYDGDVYHYYSFAEITGIVMFKDSIRIFVDFPMRAEHRFFHLYEAHSLPIYSDVYEDFLQITPPSDLLLVNKMKDKAAWMKAFTLLKECKHFEERFVCPVITALETINNSCILNMLLMKTKAVSKLCKVDAVSEYLTSTWIRDKNGWIYSVSRRTRLERVKEDARTPEIFSVSGTGFLMDQRHTYTKTEDGFILYPALNSTAHEVIVPDVDLTTLQELHIVEMNVAQEVPGNGTTVSVLGTSLRDSKWTKEHLVEEDISISYNPTPLWVAIVINFILLAFLAVGVYILRRPNFNSKAITYIPSSEENTKINGIDTDNN